MAGSFSADDGTRTRVVIVDDVRVNRESLAAQLCVHGFDTGAAWDLTSLLHLIHTAPPDVILLNMGAADGATMLQVGMDIGPSTRVVVFGMAVDREAEIIAAAEAGVSGLHLKSESFEHLLTLVSHAREGRAQCSAEVSAILMRRVYAFASQPNPDSTTDSLTARELEILKLLEQGLTNQQIASRLSVTVHTVKNHVHSLLTKLGVSSRAEAVTVFVAEKYA